MRATHLPTGLTAGAQDQRFQFADRRLARLKLALRLAERREQNQAQERHAAWGRHHALERGNPVRTYRGADFRAEP